MALIAAAIPYGWVLVLSALLALTNQRRRLKQGRAVVRRLERPKSAAETTMPWHGWRLSA